MKVVILSTWDNIGGAAVAAKRLVKALSKLSDIDVHYIVLFKKDKSNLSQSYFGGLYATWRPWLYFILERLSFYPYEKSKHVRFQFSPARFGVDLLKNKHIREADIVHLHWVNFGYVSLQSLKGLFLNKKVVWTFHDMWFFTGGCHYSGDCKHYLLSCGNCPLLKNPKTKDLSHRIWKQKDGIVNLYHDRLTLICPSHWMQASLKKSSLGRTLRSTVIPNAIDTTVYRPLNRLVLRQKYGLDKIKKYLLFGSANISDPRKGFSVIRKLFLNGELNDDFTVLIFGSLKKDHHLLASLPVLPLGYVKDDQTLCEFYNLADVFLLPSTSDNLPNTAVEAIACGTPVVAFNTGGIPDIVEHQVNGYLAEIDSSYSFGEGISYVVSGQNWESLSAQAREKAVTHFGFKKVASQHEEVYRTALKGT